MKKVLVVGLVIVGAIVSIYYVTNNENSWSTKETLEGYDSEKAAEETPVESFKNTAPQKSATGNGLNPAHGQPGHRCDIAVGAPLTSPSSNSLLNTAPKLNPEHGQPGHRCDIKVGDPLPAT
ncbi:hypothetical protein [Galbibacter mesophilus]|uniref:hypothetical protein n=1 Tax=Galbibacter mesophilus TaxID=379069 RepID=UPI00191CD8A9|nr:hypothetical protein [Galbibacter mesophilus]MCM5663791.1 hypothetical protein [Galbibacter mesophilus]